MDALQKIICTSGYFDPLHPGHLECFRQAKALGDYLVVIVNNDRQAEQKKGRPFMTCKERMQIIAALRDVDEVIESIDEDRTVCKTIASLNPRPHVFCKGGDQTIDAIPEAAICRELKIALVDGLGEKIQSSSWLIKNSRDLYSYMTPRSSAQETTNA